MPDNTNQTQIPLSVQLAQQIAQKSYTKQLQAHADNTPHAILGQLLDSWSNQGGTSAPNNVPVGSNPEVSADYVAGNPAALGGQPGNKGNVNGSGGGATGTWDSNGDEGKAAIQSVLSSQPQQAPVPTGQPQSNTQPQPSQPLDINSQIDNINKQTALNIAKRNLSMSQPPNFWQRFGQNFAKQTGGVTQGEQLQNMAAGQKIAAQEPLQPKDIGELNAGSYKAALEATGTALTATQQKLMALTDLYGKEEQNKGVVATALHNESPNQTVLRQSIQDTADNMVNHVKNFRTLIANRPTFNSQGLNSQTQDINNKIQKGKVGKYTLVNNK